MINLFRTRATLVWFVLIAATGLSWEMGHGIGLHDVRQAGVAIIVVAFVKVRFVILDFMEIRHAPLWMRFVGETWVLIICATLVTLYLRTPLH